VLWFGICVWYCDLEVCGLWSCGFLFWLLEDCGVDCCFVVDGMLLVVVKIWCVNSNLGGMYGYCC